MIIVTAGRHYLDIDAYAGIVAYSELLIAQGLSAAAVSAAPFNSSITPSLRAITTELIREYTPGRDDEFVVIDVANPEAIADFVDLDKVSKVIDHHPGCEKFWIGKRTELQIEDVGAACTQVFEYWGAAKMEGRLTEGTTRLLMAGILDNTLGLRAQVTTDRDRAAYVLLQTKLGDSGEFAEQYFTECQTEIEKDIKSALLNDTKEIEYPGFTRVRVGQLAIWDSSMLSEKLFDDLKTTETDGRFVNLIDISEGTSFFISSDAEVKEYLATITGAQFEGDVANAGRMWLRKEIMQAALRFSGEI